MEREQSVSYVFDASALIAYLRNETGAGEAEAILLDKTVERYVHAVNLCEVYYDFVREFGESNAEKVVDDIIRTGVLVREDMDMGFWQEAGYHKGSQRRISLADCFCLALARRTGSEIITTDRAEFTPVVKQGICRVNFIR